MKVRHSKKFYIDDKTEYQLTDCFFGENGKKEYAEIYNCKGDLLRISYFNYFNKGYEETIKLPNGEISSFAVFSFEEKNPEFRIFRSDHSLLCKFIMKPNLLETEHFDRSETRIRIDIQECIFSNDSIQFNYDDLNNIYAEVYKCIPIPAKDYLDRRELTCGDKRQIEYYSLDRKIKKTMFYCNDLLLYHHRTEIEYF